MDLKRIESFCDDYRAYRRTQNCWVGTLLPMVAVIVVGCALFGAYVTYRTGVDGNAFTVAGIVIGLPALCWQIIDVRRFAIRRGQ